MVVYIISNDAEFTETVRSALLRLGDSRRICCLSEADWETSDLSRVGAGTLLIADARNAAFTQSVSDDAFAVFRQVSVHAGDTATTWQECSLDALMLQLHQDGLVSSPCPGVDVRVTLDSPWFRERRIRMASQSSLISVVRDLLWEAARTTGHLPEDRASRFCVSIGEALANAVFHGNLQVCSSLKEGQGTAFSTTVTTRESQEPYQSRQVWITETTSCFGVWVTISDEGAGFDLHETFRRCRNPEPLLCSGRGILMMQGLTDELFFNESGSEVTLVFYGIHGSIENLAPQAGPFPAHRRPPAALTEA